jgi:dipeptidyl-peptidase III
VLRQVSPESLGIFDFILELYAYCAEACKDLADMTRVNAVDLDAFLTYAATPLSNVGNYYVGVLAYHVLSLLF